MKRIIVLIFLFAGLLSTGGVVAAEIKERDPALAVSLSQLKGMQKTTLVDVRNEREFEKFRIPGSLNIPLTAIKSKAFLKTADLIIYNEGYSYEELEYECQKLKAAGFKNVSILNGGLSGWKESGGMLEGDVFSQSELNKMPSGKFFSEKNYKNWLLIDITKSCKDEDADLIPRRIHVPYTDDAKEFALKIKKVISEQTADSFLSVLILNQDGLGYEKIESIAKEAGINNIFYLKGGLVGYKSFLENQVLIQQSKDKSKEQKCQSCS